MNKRRRPLFLDTVPIQYLSTSQYFDFEVNRSYDNLDTEPEPNMEVMVCDFCGGFENVDMDKPGSLRCGTCGGKLKRIDTVNLPVEDKKVVYTEYKKKWWQFWR